MQRRPSGCPTSCSSPRPAAWRSWSRPRNSRSGLLYPPQSSILDTEVKAAVRVAETIFERKLAGVAKPADMAAFIAAHVYNAEYRKGV
jgi:hypothetical protein